MFLLKLFGGIPGFLLSLFTGQGGIAGQLEKAYEARVNSTNVADQQRYDATIKALQAQQALDQQAVQIRTLTAGYPEMRFLAFVIGGVFTFHIFLIGIGTCIAAPLGWVWLAWTLHVPPFPEPFATAEIGIIGFFYGYAAVTHVGSSIAAALIKRAG